MQRKRATTLDGLRLLETSLVDKGANRHARILLCKRDDDEGLVEKMAPDAAGKWARAWAARLADAEDEAAVAEMMAEMMVEGRAAAKAKPTAGMAKGAGADAVAEAEAQETARQEMGAWMDAMWRSQSTLRDAVENILRDDEVADKKAAIAEAMETVMARLKEVKVGKSDPPPPNPDPGSAPGAGDQGAPSPGALSISDAAGDGKHRTTGMTAEEADALRAQLADAQAKLDAAENAKTEAEKAVETAKRDAQAIAKAEATRIEKMEAELAEVRKAQAEAVEKAERLDFEKRAEEEFPNLPGSPSEKGEQLRAIHKMADGEVKDGLLKTLRQADAFAKSLTVAKGTSRAAPPAGDPTEQLVAKARELRKGDPKLSMARAMEMAEVHVPGFAERYNAEAA